VFRGRHRVVQAGRGVAERGVYEPALPFARPDRPAVPGPGIPGLPVEVEVADVTGLEVDGVAVVRAQDGDARVRPLSGLSEKWRRDRGAREKPDHDQPTMAHAASSAETNIVWT